MTTFAATAISSFLMEGCRKNIQPILYEVVLSTDQLRRLVVGWFWRIHGEKLFGILGLLNF